MAVPSHVDTPRVAYSSNFNDLLEKHEIFT